MSISVSQNTNTAQGPRDLSATPATKVTVETNDVASNTKSQVLPENVAVKSSPVYSGEGQQIKEQERKADVERRITEAARQISSDDNKKLLDNGNRAQLRYNEKIDMMIVEIIDDNGKRVGTLPPDGFVQLKEKLIEMNSAVGNLVNKRG